MSVAFYGFFFFFFFALPQNVGFEVSSTNPKATVWITDVPSVNKTMHQNRNQHSAVLFVSKHACAVSLSGYVWIFTFTPAIHTMHIHDFYLFVCGSIELMSLIRSRSKRTKNVGTDTNQPLLSADLLNILFAISHFNQCSPKLKQH